MHGYHTVRNSRQYRLRCSVLRGNQLIGRQARESEPESWGKPPKSSSNGRTKTGSRRQSAPGSKFREELEGRRKEDRSLSEG